jgi:MFS family permease
VTKLTQLEYQRERERPDDRRRDTPLFIFRIPGAMVLVDQTAVPLALPAIIRQFGVSSGQVQWVLTASLLPLAALLVLGGRLGDLAGRRRIFLTADRADHGSSPAVR